MLRKPNIPQRQHKRLLSWGSAVQVTSRRSSLMLILISLLYVDHCFRFMGFWNWNSVSVYLVTVCIVGSVLFSWFEPSKRTAGGVFSFYHDIWCLPARLFRQRTTLNAARTTNWEGGGQRGWYLTTSLVPKTTERQWQMKKMWLRDIRGIVGLSDGWEPKFVVEIWHVFFIL